VQLVSRDILKVADHESGALTAMAWVQALVQLLHHNEKARHQEHIETAKDSGAAGLLCVPLWTQKAL